jgi:hypothetical protein
MTGERLPKIIMRWILVEKEEKGDQEEVGEG